MTDPTPEEVEQLAKKMTIGRAKVLADIATDPKNASEIWWGDSGTLRWGWAHPHLRWLNDNGLTRKVGSRGGSTIHAITPLGRTVAAAWASREDGAS